LRLVPIDTPSLSDQVNGFAPAGIVEAVVPKDDGLFLPFIGQAAQNDAVAFTAAAHGPKFGE
jgi:hypothetical protein